EYGRLGQRQDDRRRRHDARSKQLAKASGIGTPTPVDLARIDRKRKKKGSNDDWTHPHDPELENAALLHGHRHGVRGSPEIRESHGDDTASSHTKRNSDPYRHRSR